MEGVTGLRATHVTASSFLHFLIYFFILLLFSLGLSPFCPSLHFHAFLHLLRVFFPSYLIPKK